MYAAVVKFPRHHLAVSAAVAAAFVMSACAAAGNGPGGSAPGPEQVTAVPATPTAAAGSTHADALPADSLFQRFIVKYRPDTAPGRDVEIARGRLAGMQAQSGVQLEWLRRLGVDADVIKTAQPLDRAAAAALMDRFSADPEVEYIEVDGILTIRKGVDVPPVQPLR